MKLYFIAILLFFFNLCLAQDSTFLDARWEVCSKQDAKFLRVDTKAGNKWLRTDFYLDNMQVQMTGPCSSVNPEVKDGKFCWFYHNKQMKHIGEYKKGKEAGEHLWYSENGSLSAKENYLNGKLDGIYEEYYPNGKIMDKSTFVTGKQNGWTTYYREDGSKQSEGNFKNGIRDGDWSFYEEDGKQAGKITFKMEFDIDEAKLHIMMPNDNWFLASKSTDGTVKYVFKRSPIVDSKGIDIIPAMMLFIDDARSYKNDISTFSIQKRQAFNGKGIKIEKTLTYLDKDFPATFKNSMVLKGSYDDNGMEHILYMVFMINKLGQGIQLYMDMTSDIAPRYENEFLATMRTLRELK